MPKFTAVPKFHTVPCEYVANSYDVYVDCCEEGTIRIGCALDLYSAHTLCKRAEFAFHVFPRGARKALLALKRDSTSTEISL